MKIILLGPPGSGKGTISEQLETEFKFQHISAGELLREEVAHKTTIGKVIKTYIEAGNLVPDEFVVQLVKIAINKKDHYILDGFPRSIEQAKHIEDLHINLVLLLDVPENIVIERLANRRVCQTGVHGYHLKYLPPKKPGICDADGTTLIQRPDDTPQIIKKRFQVYHKETQPLIDYYKKSHLLQTINAADTPDTVYAQVKKVVTEAMTRIEKR